MDKKEFQAAFSVVQTSQALKEEVLQMTHNNQKSSGRLLPKLLLVAAIIALLTTTVFAATTIINALKGGKTEFHSSGWVAPTGASYDEGPYDYYEVYVDVDIDPDAPMLVEEYYMPVLSQDYVPYFGEDLNQKATQFGWTRGLRNWEDEIMFFQRPGGTFDPTALAGVFTPSGTELEAEYVTLGSISGYLVENPFYYGRRQFYWSNGDYVFQLWVPAAYTDAQLTALVESVRPVPSIKPYLVPEDVHYEIIYGDKE